MRKIINTVQLCGCVRTGARVSKPRRSASHADTKEGFPLPTVRKERRAESLAQAFYALKLGQQTARKGCRASTGYAVYLNCAAFELSQSEMTRFEG